jgi:hypothetical protein
MTNSSKNTGTKQETATVNYLISRGYLHAKRVTQKGAADEGDVVLGDGYPVVIESKGGRGAVTNIPKGIDELLAEIINAKAETGFCVVKRNRTTDLGRYYAIMPLNLMMELIERLYPPPPQPKKKSWGRVR